MKYRPPPKGEGGAVASGNRRYEMVEETRWSFGWLFEDQGEWELAQREISDDRALNVRPVQQVRLLLVHLSELLSVRTTDFVTGRVTRRRILLLKSSDQCLGRHLHAECSAGVLVGDLDLDHRLHDVECARSSHETTFSWGTNTLLL